MLENAYMLRKIKMAVTDDRERMIFMNKKYCPVCGNEVEADALFCGECGCNLKEFAVKTNNPPKPAEGPSAPTPIGNSPYRAPGYPGTVAKPPKKKQGFLIPVLIVVAVFLLFTIFNCLICTNTIPTITPGLARYQYALLSLMGNDPYADQSGSPDDSGSYDNSNRDVDTTDVGAATIWNPDNDQSLTTNPSTDTGSGDYDNVYIVNVGNSTLNLRSEKSTTSKILKSIPNNTELVITSIDGNWGYTTYSGKSGWVSMEFVKKKLTDGSFTISASSSLTSGMVYSAENVLDGDPSTCWAEGVDGVGIGEKLFISNSSAFSISKITINNGYCKSEKLFNENARPKKLKLTFDNGKSVIISLHDGYENRLQEAEFIEVTTRTVTIEIMDVYNGSKYEDTCISEIKLS